jgi:ferrous-iron efflux pump FieF
MSPSDPSQARAYETQLRRATYASVLTALVLIAAKLLAWLWTGSISVLASLVDSLMDSIASAINLVAVRYSLAPPDAEHRFGHGKAEPLAGLAQAGFVSGSAVFLLFHAIDRLRYPRPLRDIGIGIVVMVFSILSTAALLTLQRRVIKKTQSTAIRADALHYATDLLTNLAVVAGLLLASFGWGWADPVFAIVIAVYIFYSAIRIGFEGFEQLMDRELPRDTQEKILSVAKSHPDVLGVHDLRTRRSGRLRFVQLHLELEDHLPLTRAHAVADQVEAQILTLLPNAEVIIHQDPATSAEETDHEPWRSDANA